VKRCLNLKCVLKCADALQVVKNELAKAELRVMVVPLAKARTVPQRQIVQLVQASLLHVTDLEKLRAQQGVAVQRAARAQSVRTAVTRVDAHLAVVVALIKLALHPVIQHLRAQLRVEGLHVVKASVLPASGVRVRVDALD
jgi:hypothetical protein